MRRSFVYPVLGLLFCLAVGGAVWLVTHDLPTDTGSASASGSPGRTATGPADGEAQITAWKPIFIGVEMCAGSAASPRLMQMRAVRIDLHERGIDFLVTPSNGKQPLDVNARTTSDFLAEFKCQVAVNGSFFGPLATRPGDPQDINGLSVSRGDRYSPPGTKYAALLIGKDRRVWVAPAPVNSRKAYNGVAGDTPLLTNGKYSLPADDKQAITITPHPRSAAGVSRDGRYLILLTIDGRQPGYSEGATKPETADWLKRLGAWNAINLDGGGSSALVIEGPDGKPVTLNRPCGPPVGTQRRVANHLGVFAKKRA